MLNKPENFFENFSKLIFVNNCSISQFVFTNGNFPLESNRQPVNMIRTSLYLVHQAKIMSIDGFQNFQLLAVLLKSLKTEGPTPNSLRWSSLA